MRCDQGDVDPIDYGNGITMDALLAPALPAPARAPDFTVGSALRWLGHECPDHRCCAPIDTLRASVWFIRRARQCATLPVWTRVLVDTPGIDDDVASSLQVMHQVNGCTRRDAIEVRFQRHQVLNCCNPPVAHPVPVSPLMGVHPVEMPGPSDGDLQAITLASQW